MNIEYQTSMGDYKIESKLLLSFSFGFVKQQNCSTQNLKQQNAVNWELQN